MADKVECAICDTVAEHGDDFCHECGHGFGYGSAAAAPSDPGAEAEGPRCPMCSYGEVQELSYGIRQCDSCGYTARDWSTV